MFGKQKLKKINELLNKVSNIVITTHKSPDGDAMGSSLALCNYLNKIGKNCKVVVPDFYPAFLHWLPGDSDVVIHLKDSTHANKLIEDAEIIFSLDYNDLGRIGNMQEFVAKAEAKKILIDHHQEPGNFPDFSYSDTNSSSTSQMVYEFIEGLGGGNLIDKDIANCLYTGIMTDTGSFRFPSTTAKTHRIVAVSYTHLTLPRELWV